MRGLYAIADTDALHRRSIDVLSFAKAVLDAHPAALQLRDKSGGSKRTLELLRALAPLADAAEVPLFANDRPDLALLARCSGVHLGQEDLPVPVARELASRCSATLRIGVSTHDLEQIDAALLDGPDYIAIGPIFATQSKDRPSAVVGLEALASMVARVRASHPNLPIVAIGGITLETARAVGALCNCAAVIGALLPDTSGQEGLDEVRARARALDRAIRGDAP